MRNVIVEAEVEGDVEKKKKKKKKKSALHLPAFTEFFYRVFFFFTFLPFFGGGLVCVCVCVLDLNNRKKKERNEIRKVPQRNGNRRKNPVPHWRSNETFKKNPVN